MFKKIDTLFQSLIPQHWLSTSLGRLADSENPRVKNFLIRQFLKRFKVNLEEAQIEDPFQYESFNSFFIRKLKPELRPFASGNRDIGCPVDGTIAQIGSIAENKLLQAKNFYFDLEGLLGGDKALAANFYNGEFSTLYLAPHNYHRVHMPINGQLEKTIYVPGKLFSVNCKTAECRSELYSRNERLISVFKTDAGLMAVILVGAMIVGSIKTIWLTSSIRSTKIITETFSGEQFLQKGEELGYFKLGSTVILLFQKDKICWNSELSANKSIKMGQLLGKILF